MASDPLDALRLTLMQDVLPVGLAVVERARRGGAREVLAALEGNASHPGDPLTVLRQEGEPAASQLRDSLDRLQPGLGNPVMKVEVRDVPQTPAAASSPVGGSAASGGGADVLAAVPAAGGGAETTELEETLARIAARLAELERRVSSWG
jgi:hypothetical protein